MIYDFSKMNLYDLQAMDISFFNNIEELLSYREIETIILKHPIINFKQNFKQKNNIPVLYQILNDYKKGLITSEGMLFMIDGEYQDIPIIFFQTIFKDLYLLINSKICKKKWLQLKNKIKIVGIFLILFQNSRKKIICRLKKF